MRAIERQVYGFRSFKRFTLREDQVAPVIYEAQPHRTVGAGYVLGPQVRKDLKSFLAYYNSCTVKFCPKPYYRIDAYIQYNYPDGIHGQSELSLCILEINASFVDGWGTALNLSRAAGIPIDPASLVFPERFATINQVYKPELKLFVDELAALGKTNHRIVDWTPNPTEPTYVYGRVGSIDTPHIIPYDGIRLDNKMYLARFGRKTGLIWTPEHFTHESCPWEDIPADVVLKFCDKGSEECQRTRASVIFGKPSGKAPTLKRYYREGLLLAQRRVPVDRQVMLEYGEHMMNTQLVILAIGDEPITGYVQYSTNKMINDNSIHGPLQIR